MGNKIRTLMLGIAAVALLDCTGEISGSQPSTPTKETDEAGTPNAAFNQTQTVIKDHCVSCHAAGSPNGVFDSYEALLGTGYVVPGDASSSALCTVALADPPPLPANLPLEVAQDICAWIAAGALSE